MRGAENTWLVGAGFVVLGAAIAALGPALRSALPDRGAGLAAALFVGAGAAVAATGLLPLDCAMSEEACRDRWRAGELSWQHEAHLWLGIAFEALLVATPFALARALWPRPVAVAALQAGVVGLILTAGAWLGYAADADGLVQRLGFAVVHVWVGLVAVGVLDSARGRAPSARVQLPGSVSRVWAGEGEMVLRPTFLWRRFPQRFRYRREVTWVTDELWLVEDEAAFERGWVTRRRLYCAVVAPAVLHVTAADLPDGGEAEIEEDGYTVAPCRLAVPFGPVQLLTRCSERAGVEDEQTLRGTMELRWLGVPAATLTARVRPGMAVGDSPPRTPAYSGRGLTPPDPR
jgi:Protein of unknown function (DUF998)